MVCEPDTSAIEKLIVVFGSIARCNELINGRYDGHVPILLLVAILLKLVHIGL